MKRVLAAGFVLAVLAALAMWIGQMFNISMGNTIFGVAIGALLALVPGVSPGKKIIGFLIGIFVTLIMFAFQAQFLPLTKDGATIGAFLTVLVLTIISALLHNKIPFWTIVAGIAAIGGAYGTQFLAAPQNFKTESIAALGGVLFVSALGFLGATLAELIPGADGEGPALEESSIDTPDDNAGADILTSTKG